MDTIQVETIDSNLARKLSGKQFFVAEGKIAVSEKDVTLITSSPEGFGHVKGLCIFLYFEMQKEGKETNKTIWTCGLKGEDGNVLALKHGETVKCSLTCILEENLNKLIHFPSTTGQFIRFDYNGDQWEMVVIPYFRGTEILLRKIINKKCDYDPVFITKNNKVVIDLYPTIEYFKELVIQHYQN